jgi:hypothetical protein
MVRKIELLAKGRAARLRACGVATKAALPKHTVAWVASD